MMVLNYDIELAKYLALRESLGVPVYQISPVLNRFVQYLNEHCQGDVVRVSQVLDWVCSEPYSISTQHFRLSAARVFLKHLKAFVPEIEIPSCNLLARTIRPEPFVFSDVQLAELLDVAGGLDSKKTIAPLTVQTMFGLMACTGLRPGEAMRLRTSQVILDELQPRLLILRTKFYKTRWVPLHPTTVSRLKFHLDAAKGHTEECFFASKTGRPVNRITLHRIFQELILKTSIRARGSQLRPTLHSLRHTFAVRRLQHWYEDGQDVRELLPNLSVYLGHVDPSSSYWYLTCTPELMTAAAQRFEVYGSRRGGWQ
jgi:integrase/recombinase XerD